MATNETTIESLFERFRRSGDAAALAAIFDRTAAELGRVAMYLTGGDAQAAADALQATWLSAITHARRWDSERRLLPWLLGMLANHVRSHQRAARRTNPVAGAGAEALASLLASDDPVRASQDGEFQRLLADALADLPAPFREAVTLHVQHGLTAVEIGEALGRPAGTVRTQIVRGLERLRQRLPVGLAGAGIALAALTAAQLGRVREAVLADVAPPAAPFAAARGLSLGVLLAAALAIAVTLALRSEMPPAPPATGASPVAAARADATAHEANGERVRVAAAPQDPRPAAAPRRRITVQVRRADEPKAVAGECVCLSLDELRLAATDAAGNAVFDDVPPSLMHTVFLSGVGESATVPARRLPPPAEFDEKVTIDVSGGEALCVRVVDAARKPVAGAEVEGNGAQNAARTWLPLGRTDERGELRLRNQRLAQYRARADGHGTSTFASPRPAADGHACTLALGPAIAPLRGRVVDADGVPIAAQLGTYEFGNGAMAPWYDHTDAGGAFTFAWVGAGHAAVIARAAGAKGTLIGILRVDLPRSEDLVVRLQPEASLDVTALFADGRAAPNTMVRGRLLADGAFELPFCRPQLATGYDGRLLLAGLAPGRWLFEVDFGQAAVQRTFDLTAGVAATWTAQAVPLHELRLRVLDERGAPLASWSVHVLDPQQRIAGGQGFTTESGELHPAMKLLLPPDRPFTLALHQSHENGGNSLFPAHKVPGVVADGARLDVVVPDRCRTTHRVRGRLVDAQGAPVAGSLRVVSPVSSWQGEVAAAAADGSFALGPLPPGRYAAEVLRDDKPRFRLARLEVPADRDLDLGDVVLAPEVRVRAASAGRATVPDDVRLELVRDDGGQRYDFDRGDGGEFVSEAVPPGRYTLRGSGRTHFVASEPVVVGAGDAAVTFRCAPAPTLRIEIPLLDDERAQAGWAGTIVLRAGNDEVLRRSIWRRFRGHVPTPFVVEVAAPPGSYTVVVDWSNARELRGVCELGERGGVVTLAR